MGWSRQAAVGESENARVSNKTVELEATLAGSNSMIPVSKPMITAQRSKGKSEPEEAVVDSDVMTLQELIDNVRLLPFLRLSSSSRTTRLTMD